MPLAHWHIGTLAHWHIGTLNFVSFFLQIHSNLFGLISLYEDLTILHRSARAAVLLQFFSQYFQIFRFTCESQDDGDCFSAAMAGVQHDAQPLFARWQGFGIFFPFILKSKIRIRAEYKSIFIRNVFLWHLLQLEFFVYGLSCIAYRLK